MARLSQEEQAIEYLDLLVSMELCVKLARKHGEKVNTSLRNCCTALMQRIRDHQNYLIVQGVRKQPFPAGAVDMMRRQLDQFLTDEGGKDE